MKNIPSVDEIVQHFVKTRTMPYKTLAGLMYEGDIFYDDIQFYLKNVLKIKTLARERIFKEVCEKLRSRRFWIHS